MIHFGFLPLHLALHEPCIGVPWKGGKHLHQIFEPQTPISNAPHPSGDIWSHLRCGHTYLLPVAVCGEWSVSSAPQRCSVVVEVTSRVHLVLNTQKKTRWLESDLGSLKTTSPPVVANAEQSLASFFKNPHTHKNPMSQRYNERPTDHGSLYLCFLFFFLTVYQAFMWRIRAAHFPYAKS